jgi:hypothetical protein
MCGMAGHLLFRIRVDGDVGGCECVAGLGCWRLECNGISYSDQRTQESDNGDTI